MKRNFTLVEILGVVALIAILGTIGFAGYSFARNRGKESATQAMITRLAAALESAREREGFLPPTNDSFMKIKIDTVDQSIAFVDMDGTDATDDNTFKKTYSSSSAVQKRKMKFYRDFMKSIQGDSLSRHLDTNQYVTDGWGGVIYYRYPGKFNKGSFDLISAGSDGKFGESGVTEPSSTISDYRDSSGEMKCDDIGNF